MPHTLDQFPGERYEEIVQFSGSQASGINLGEQNYVSGVGFAFVQPDGVAYIRSGNINSFDHQGLRQLIHLAEEGGPWEGFSSVIRDVGPSGSPFPTASIWWTDSSRQFKIVEKLIVRNPNKTPSTIQWKVYASGSTSPIVSMTDAITYVGIFETSRTRTIP